MLRTQLMRTMHDALLHYVTAGKMMRWGKALLILASRSEILCLTICTGWNKYMDYGGHFLAGPRHVEALHEAGHVWCGWQGCALNRKYNI